MSDIDKHLSREEALLRTKFLSLLAALQSATGEELGALSAEDIMIMNKELALFSASFFAWPEVLNAQKRNEEVTSGDTDTNPFGDGSVPVTDFVQNVPLSKAEKAFVDNYPGQVPGKEPDLVTTKVFSPSNRKELKQNPNYGTVPSKRHNTYIRKLLDPDNGLKEFFESWYILLSKVNKDILEKKKFPTRDLRTFLDTFPMVPATEAQRATDGASHRGKTSEISRELGRTRRINRRLGYALRKAQSNKSDKRTDRRKKNK